MLYVLQKYEEDIKSNLPMSVCGLHHYNRSPPQIQALSIIAKVKSDTDRQGLGSFWHLRFLNCGNIYGSNR